MKASATIVPAALPEYGARPIGRTNVQEAHMQFSKKSAVYTAIALGAALAATACDQRPQTVGQKADQAMSNIARNANEAADDAALTAKVKAALLAEPGLQSLQIGVDTKDAVVTLTGTVASPPLKDRAKQVAAGVSGVRSVIDNLQTQSTG